MGARHLLLGAAAMIPAAAFGQTRAPAVPPITQDQTVASAPLAPIPIINQAPVPLTPKEARGVALANRYAATRQMPVQGNNGAVVFLYGSTLPSVVCAPLYVCDIALQPGEVVNDVNIGDSVRWKVSPSVSGTGTDKVTHVLVKPTDSGLTTDLIISTNLRTYTIKLVSTPHSWMPLVSFDYPDDLRRAWANYEQRQANYRAASVLPTGQSLASLDFNYRLGGDDPAWKPLRVYSDGQKTYIQMPPTISSGDLPALVALGRGGGLFSSAPTQIVNYRIEGDTYVVDKVLDRAELISGVGGDQEQVTITHSQAGG